MIRILIADDHAGVRMGLRLLLEQQGDFQVVGEASDGIEAVDLAVQLMPDVVLMDITMPRLDGNGATQRLRDMALPIKVLILSMHSEVGIVNAALAAGACGYVVKASVRGDLVPAVHATVKGEMFLSPSIRDLIPHLE